MFIFFTPKKTLNNEEKFLRRPHCRQLNRLERRPWNGAPASSAGAEKLGKNSVNPPASFRDERRTYKQFCAAHFSRSRGGRRVGAFLFVSRHEEKKEEEERIRFFFPIRNNRNEIGCRPWPVIALRRASFFLFSRFPPSPSCFPISETNLTKRTGSAFGGGSLRSTYVPMAAASFVVVSRRNAEEKAKPSQRRTMTATGDPVRRIRANLIRRERRNKHVLVVSNGPCPSKPTFVTSNRTKTSPSSTKKKQKKKKTDEQFRSNPPKESPGDAAVFISGNEKKTETRRSNE